MVFSHYMRRGPETGQGLGRGSVDSSMLCGNVHTLLRQGQEPGPIDSYCIILSPCATLCHNIEMTL